MRERSQAWLHGALLSMVTLLGSCGVADRVRAWWSDEEPASVPTPAEPGEPVAAGGTTGGTVGGTVGGTSAAATAPGSSGAPTGPSVTSGLASSSGAPGSTTALLGGSTTIPMSFARPPTTDTGDSGDSGGRGGSGGTSAGSEGTAGATSGTSDDTGGSDSRGTSGPSTTGTTPPSASVDLACLAGSWTIDDFSTYYRRIIRVQAVGRAVRSLGSKGRYTLEFDGARLRGEAKHLRLRYSTRLADREVRYTIDVHGTFETTVALEGANMLRVVPYTGGTIRAKETARFEGGKVQTRKPKLPTDGLYEVACTATSLSLSPIEGSKTRDAIRFVRP